MNRWVNNEHNFGGMSGKYTHTDGKEYTISFEISIQYDKKADSRTLKDGENIINFSGDPKDATVTENFGFFTQKSDTKKGWYKEDGTLLGESEKPKRSNGDYYLLELKNTNARGESRLLDPKMGFQRQCTRPCSYLDYQTAIKEKMRLKTEAFQTS